MLQLPLVRRWQRWLRSVAPPRSPHWRPWTSWSINVFKSLVVMCEDAGVIMQIWECIKRILSKPFIYRSCLLVCFPLARCTFFLHSSVEIRHWLVHNLLFPSVAVFAVKLRVRIVKAEAASASGRATASRRRARFCSICLFASLSGTLSHRRNCK
jgi:hypothetical protein